MASTRAGPAGTSRDTEGSPMFAMDTDASFSATPLIQSKASSPKIGEIASGDPTFMQNQIAIQRSPSTAKEHASIFNEQLSVNSSGSHGAVVSDLISEDPCYENELVRGRSDSTSSIVKATNNCSLSKSLSERSIKSVRSVHAVGSHPLGTLHLHSLSPTPPPNSINPQEFLKSGDVLIVRDVPGGSLIGYDTIAFTIKPNEPFDGIKDIPPGTHFFWGGSNKTSLRNGFWIVAAKRASTEYGAIHVRRWDKDNEIIGEEISKAEVRIQQEGIEEIFGKLQTYMTSTSGSTSIPKTTDTSYALKSHSTTPRVVGKDPNLWYRLTSCVKGSLLTRLTGNKEWNHWQVSSMHDHQDKTPLHRDQEITLDQYRDEVFTFTFPQYNRTFSEESIGRARTEQAMDSTSHVLKIISKNCSHEDSDEVIGELQFCYVTGMLLGNVACMEQWAHVVKTVFRAFDLVLNMPHFFKKFIEAVHAQFIYDDEGLEGSILDHDPGLTEDLKLTLTKFKVRLNEMLLDRGSSLDMNQMAVGTAFGELETWVWKWDWDLRANYVRSGKFQNEDGHWVDAELTDFLAEDERGQEKDKKKSRTSSMWKLG